MKNIGIIIPTIAASLVSFSCSDSSDAKNVIDKATLAAIYVSLLEETSKTQESDLEAASFHHVDSVLARFGVTEQQVRETIKHYSEDLRRWKDFYVEVLAIQSKAKKTTPSR
jgi:hypothetical protein